MLRLQTQHLIPVVPSKGPSWCPIKMLGWDVLQILLLSAGGALAKHTQTGDFFHLCSAFTQACALYP